MSRTRFTIKNSIAGLVSKILTLGLGFFSRTIFIHLLGSEYLGVSGLYTEVLSVLSFAELGFGSALTFSMYKPVAEKDYETTIKLLDLYKNIYRIIALIITVLGISMIPFIDKIVNGIDIISLFELKLYFCFYLINSVSSYFVSYKFSFLKANQKDYITTNINTIVTLFINIIQIIIIVIFKNFFFYLLTTSVLLLVSRFFISIYLNSKFPILKQKCTVKLTKEEKAPIITNVKGLMFHQFAGIAIHSTDNILISTFSIAGTISVGLLSNYNMLINSVVAFASIIFLNVNSSFGNLVATSTKEKYRKAFLEINFLNFWIYGFCSIAFFILIPPFITLWIGKENLIDQVSFFLIIINAYFVGQSSLFNSVRSAKGNFGMDKWWSFLQAIVNLVVSYIGVTTIDLPGIFVGTVVSRIVYLITRPSSMYRYLFGRSPLEYYQKFVIYFITVLFAGVLTYFTTLNVLTEITVYNFFIACLLVAIIPNVTFFAIYVRSTEFKNLIIRIKNIKGILKSHE